MNNFSRKLVIIIVVIITQSSLGTKAIQLTSQTLWKESTRDGYVKYSNGLLIQWGNLASSYSNKTIYLPISFLDSNYIAIVGVNDSTVDSISVVSCKIKKQNISSFVLVPVATWGADNYVYATEGMNWFAIGRWK